MKCLNCGHSDEMHWTDDYGYIMVMLSDGTQIHEHILVVEKNIGRYLKEGESVHHINHIRSDNKPQNLAVMSNDDDHAYIHKHDKKTR